MTDYGVYDRKSAIKAIKMSDRLAKERKQILARHALLVKLTSTEGFKNVAAKAAFRRDVATTKARLTGLARKFGAVASAIKSSIKK